MAESWTRQVVLLVMLLLLSIGTGVLSQHQEATVKITNDMAIEQNLTVHCKSKNDDLGFHTLKPSDVYDFSFTPNLWGSTLFFCSFQWLGSFYYYDIYVKKRDLSRCAICDWSVKPNRSCLFDWDTKKYDLCDKWNPEMLI